MLKTCCVYLSWFKPGLVYLSWFKPGLVYLSWFKPWCVYSFWHNPDFIYFSWLKQWCVYIFFSIKQGCICLSCFNACYIPSLCLMCMFCWSLFVFLNFFFYVVCSSSTYVLWLPLWYLQTLLKACWIYFSFWSWSYGSCIYKYLGISSLKWVGIPLMVRWTWCNIMW